ncbi:MULTISPECIES: hypothetical protein [unclassified Streptomyces]|uniref:hypothetical protein n=1 Tax=unclassified Streptomyces TaxID=2593676 RepID=UPI0006F2000B|nr:MULTISPECIES: hypothetical protein [unclassified Streptomyces]KQX59384.1 hypothetical protein ASD33_03640 [Streptomyces sp. Root1304]KRB00645.1 hypothetical protein ASE09_03640 [Streptomyces sp. Root66D1]
MTTKPATSTEPAATATTGTPATGPSTRALRFTAAGGFLFLAVCLVVTGALGLLDAVDGDGVDDGFMAAGFWAVGLGAATGVAALIGPRKGLVVAQYALGAAGPLLALMD